MPKRLTKQKNHPKKSVAFKNLFSALRELELIYHLSPKLPDKRVKQLKAYVLAFLK